MTHANQAAPRLGGRVEGADGRIPSLDGIRALSITSVLMLHLSDTKNFFAYPQVEPFNFGYIGVRVFFVISGFLITSLLLGEIAATGTISLKKFYIRRTMRIFPCSYVYLAVMGLIGLMSASDLIHGYTYTMNYHRPDRSWHASHLWSLSVEEQFYLLWPAVLCYAGRRKAFFATAGVFVFAPVIRLFIWVFVPAYRPYLGESFETVADALATGCLLAQTRGWLWNQQWYRGFLQSRWMALTPFVAFGCSALFTRPRIFVFIAQTVLNVCVALCID